MAQRSLMYLNLRQRHYSIHKRDWLFEKALSCLDESHVLEVHSFVPLEPPGLQSHSFGKMQMVTLADRHSYVISQFYARCTESENIQGQRVEPVFYLDARCLDTIQIARQSMHLVHRFTKFTPVIQRLEVWCKEVPELLLESLELEKQTFYVEEAAYPGLIISITCADAQDDGQETWAASFSGG